MFYAIFSFVIKIIDLYYYLQYIIIIAHWAFSSKFSLLMNTVLFKSKCTTFSAPSVCQPLILLCQRKCKHSFYFSHVSLCLPAKLFSPLNLWVKLSSNAIFPKMCPRNQPIFWELSEKTGRKKKKKMKIIKLKCLFPLKTVVIQLRGSSPLL